MKTVWSALGTVVLACAGGCGTVLNLASRDPVIPFGGVQKDLEVLQTSGPAIHGDPPGGLGAAVLFACIPAELCLSLVGDSLTLPLALWMRNERDARDGTCSRTCDPAAAGKPDALSAADGISSDSQ